MICVNFTINEMDNFELVGYSNSPTTELGIIFRNSVKIDENTTDINVDLFTRLGLDDEYVKSARNQFEVLLKTAKELIDTIESSKLDELLK